MKQRTRFSSIFTMLVAFFLALAGLLVGAFSTLPFLKESSQLYLAATYFALGCLSAIFLYGLLASPVERILARRNQPSGDGVSKEARAFAAEEAKKLREELEADVANRTRELEKTNARLMRTREKLFEVEKLAFLGQIGAQISHQMKNPLAIIKTAAFFISDASEEEEILEQAKIITHETDRMVESINSLLRFARQAAASTMASVDLGALIKETLNAAGLGGRLQGIRLETSIEERTPAIMADAAQIQQVLLNMVINSAQAMPEGGVLTVSLKRDGEFLEMRVTDTGIGIPGDRLGRIWEPFRSDKTEGTGIGLTICKGILDRHKASVNVVSEEGMGTTFTMRFPLWKEEDHIGYSET